MERVPVWPRVATFVAVTYVWSWIFMAMAISAGEITPVAALGGMWSPFVGVLVTRVVFPDGRRRGSLAGLGWGWGPTRWQLWSYLLPLLYVGAAYLAAWASGVAGFADAPAGELAKQALGALALGTIANSIVALGEEAGWQGYLVPQLHDRLGFTRAAFLRGIIWSLWHFPLIVGGVYGSTELPLWYRLSCFTVTMTAVSFAFTWLRIRSGSLWTGVFLHAMHNLYLQEIFPSLSEEHDRAIYFIDEFGAFTALAAVVVALLFWLKRGELGRPSPT